MNNYLLYFLKKNLKKKIFEIYIYYKKLKKFKKNSYIKKLKKFQKLT